MKMYLQTEVQQADSEATEPRGRVLVMETPAPAHAVKLALTAITEGLGRMTVIPAPAHEANLKAILPRDLAALDVPAGASEGGEAILRVLRTPGATGAAGQADVIGLDYDVVVREH